MGLSQIGILRNSLCLKELWNYARCLITLLFLLCSFGRLLASEIQANQMMYLIHAREVEKAFTQYQTYYQEKGKHDFELLQNLSLILLEQGIKNPASDIQLMSIFGAGIAMNEKAYYVLEEGLNSSDPQIQVVALNFLAQTQNDYATILINRLMSSPYPLMRLEAAFQLAKKKHPLATSQIEALMYKLDVLMPIFPKLFATSGDAQAIRILKKLLTHQECDVRCEAILSLADTSRDDLLPHIRRLATHHDIAQAEACAVALGMLNDDQSRPILKKLAESKTPAIRLAALQSLSWFGDENAKEQIKALAKTGDIFAIHVLAEISGSEDLLAALCKSPYLQVRVNAAWSLLQHQDKRCLKGILDILIHDMRDIAYTDIYSLGKGLTAIRAIPSALQKLEETPILNELSLTFREEILDAAIELPEDVFIKIAERLFETRQNDLIPLLTDLLINLDTPESIALLKKQQQRAGAPLIRNYCNLALYKMKEEGPYVNNLKEWIKEQKGMDLVRFRAFVPFDKRDNESPFQLTPEESTRLLVESFETIAQSQENEGIDLILQTIIDGNPKNRYLLAGLLLRASQ